MIKSFLLLSTITLAYCQDEVTLSVKNDDGNFVDYAHSPGKGEAGTFAVSNINGDYELNAKVIISDDKKAGMKVFKVEISEGKIKGNNKESTSIMANRAFELNKNHYVFNLKDSKEIERYSVKYLIK